MKKVGFGYDKNNNTEVSSVSELGSDDDRDYYGKSFEDESSGFDNTNGKL